jgi:hypothetical protein
MCVFILVSRQRHNLQTLEETEKRPAPFMDGTTGFDRIFSGALWEWHIVSFDHEDLA